MTSATPPATRRTILATLLAAALALLSGCTTVPGTGRAQLNFLTPADEARMGLDAFTEIKRTQAVSTDRAANDLVSGIGHRIAGVVSADLPDAQWEFVVFDSTEVNAFCLPGGKVGVYTGLLRLAGNDPAEIAFVMGHEVAHAVARHGGERVSQQAAASLVGTALQVGIREMQPEQQALIMGLYGVGSQLGVLLPYSRTHESEADRLGLEYIARAGYDPRASIRFWRKMAATKGDAAPPEWLSTHPSDASRIANLEALLPAALATYNATATTSGRGPLFTD